MGMSSTSTAFASSLSCAVSGKADANFTIRPVSWIGSAAAGGGVVGGGGGAVSAYSALLAKLTEPTPIDAPETEAPPVPSSTTNRNVALPALISSPGLSNVSLTFLPCRQVP